MKPCPPDCQCPKCDPEMAAIAKMTPQQYAEWLRLKSAKRRQDAILDRMRAATAATPDATPDDLGRALQGFGSVQTAPPPDPYAKALAERRDHVTPADHRDALRAMETFRRDFVATSLTGQLAAHTPADGDVYRNPPDGYAIALDKMKESLK